MANRLGNSASPYLLQHQHNPVDWYQWGEEAFAAARHRDVPVLLSVGYSACHWCHVMAHESFEDAATAAEMNELFVNIKVDREERPDVDAVYMEATQAMTGQGGWPMTVWLHPDGRPFYAGTYFPSADRQGMPSFRRVMRAVREAWDQRRAEVDGQAATLTDAIGATLPAPPDLPGEEALAGAVRALSGQFDPRHGGFGAAPKFPQQPVLELLLRIHRRPWAEGATEMVRRTLAAMAAGGIRDQIGGGFARYSVDAHWLVPHFEKMLYDNAQLARLYLWAGQELGEKSFREVAIDTLEYLLSDLRHPDGGFYSAEDADSEGEEGKFYVWSHAELMEVAGDDGPVAAAHFGVTEAGNFEGVNILHRAVPLPAVAERFAMDPGAAAEAVHRAARAMLARRAQRVRPGLDDKVIAAWNGLAIRALAEAGAVLDSDRYRAAAREAAEFVLIHLRRPDGRLLRSFAKGRPGPPGFLDDHAGMAVALLSLYATTGEIRWFQAAGELMGAMVDLFADPEGGFFTTGSDAEALIKRPKDHFDNPLPSGNSLAAEALALWSSYTGDTDAWERAEGTVRVGAALLDRYPSGAGHLAGVLSVLLDGPRELAVIGPDAHQLAAVAWRRFQPGLAVAIDSNGQAGIPLLEGRHRPGETLAYVCRRFACQAPVSEAQALEEALAATA